MKRVCGKRNGLPFVLFTKISHAFAIAMQEKIPAKEYVLAVGARSPANKAVRIPGQVDIACLNLQYVNPYAAQGSSDGGILGDSGMIRYYAKVALCIALFDGQDCQARLLRVL